MKYPVEELRDVEVQAHALFTAGHNVPGIYEAHVWATLPRKEGGRYRLRILHMDFKGKSAVGMKKFGELRLELEEKISELIEDAKEVRVWFFKGRPYGKFAS